MTTREDREAFKYFTSTTFKLNLIVVDPINNDQGAKDRGEDVRYRSRCSNREEVVYNNVAELSRGAGFSIE